MLLREECKTKIKALASLSIPEGGGVHDTAYASTDDDVAAQ